MFSNRTQGGRAMVLPKSPLLFYLSPNATSPTSGFGWPFYFGYCQCLSLACLCLSAAYVFGYNICISCQTQRYSCSPNAFLEGGSYVSVFGCILSQRRTRNHPKCTHTDLRTSHRMPIIHMDPQDAFGVRVQGSAKLVPLRC